MAVITLESMQFPQCTDFSSGTVGTEILIMRRMMASIFALVLLSTLAVPALASEPGSLCVAPAEKPNGRPKNLSNPAGGNQINSYAVCIDDRAPIHVGDKQGNSRGLGSDLPQQHLVRISEGTVKEVNRLPLPVRGLRQSRSLPMVRAALRNLVAYTRQGPPQDMLLRMKWARVVPSCITVGPRRSSAQSAGSPGNAQN